MKQWFLVMLMTVSDVFLEVSGCCKTLTAEFTVMGNLLVNPVMLRKIIFPDGPSTPLTHTFRVAGMR